MFLFAQAANVKEILYVVQKNPQPTSLLCKKVQPS